MKRHHVLCLLLLLGLSNGVTRAQIGFNGIPHPSAVLDLKSPANDKVFLPPRLTSAQRKAIVGPPVGSFVFDTDKNTVFLSDGQNWLPLIPDDPNQLFGVSHTASNGAEADYFGGSVSISGDYAIVGAKIKDGYQGTAYIFARSNGVWTEVQQLTASDARQFDVFGSSVAISGDYAIVGADEKTVNGVLEAGAAYIFARNGATGVWAQQQKLTPVTNYSAVGFGYSVALSGDYAIIGARNTAINAAGYGQGTAYIFVRNGTVWNQQQELTASNGTTDDYFGTSVSISGDYALVGASGKKVGNNANQGAAYLFARNGTVWSRQELTASDGQVHDIFGISVAISGNYAVVGALYAKIGINSNQGAAYVFARNGNTSTPPAWSQQQKLTNSDGAADDYFGNSVAMSGDNLLVGVRHKHLTDKPNQGAAYLYSLTGTQWNQRRRTTLTDPAYTENGTSVGISGTSFLIGGPGFLREQGKVSFGLIE